MTAAPAPAAATLAAPAPAARLRLGRLRLLTRLAMPAAQAARHPGLSDADLPAQLHGELAPFLANGDPSVWVIRRLRVSTTVNDGNDPAGALARAVRNAIARALRGDGDGIRHFADRSSRLAAFLADLAEGDAFDRWYHARYRDLAPLPMPQALRLALTATPDDALPALLHLLADRRLARFIDGIGPEGADAVLAVLVSGTPGVRVAIDHQLLRAIVAAEPGFLRWRTGHQARLALTIMTAERLPAAQPTGLSAIAAAVAAALPAIVQPRSPPPGVATARATGDQSVTPSKPRGQATSTRITTSRASALDLAEPLVTPFAGVFLLWRSAIELGLLSLLDAPAAQLHFAAALAGPDRDAALRDPALHWLAGHVPDAADPAPRPPPPLAVARLLVARAAPHIPALMRQRVARTHILQDADTEDWLAAGSAAAIARIVAAMGLAAPQPATADARPAAPDIVHFATAPAWQVAARAAHADLGRRLPGLACSSAAWIARNLVAGPGQLELADDGPRLTLPRVPLDLVLRMTGIDGTRVDLGNGRHVRLILPGPT
jgi:hypothetical protein